VAEAKDGIKAALAATNAAELARQNAETRASNATQAELFGASDIALDAQLPIAPAPGPRSAGRPSGSRNRLTEAVAAYLVGRYGDPLEGLMAIGMGRLEHTAAELGRAMEAMRAGGVKLAVDAKGREVGIDVNELAKLKKACLEAALPYIHAKRAPEDDKGNPVLPVLNIGRFDATPGVSKGLSAEDFIDVTPIQQNQGFSRDAPASSDDETSDDEG